MYRPRAGIIVLTAVAIAVCYASALRGMLNQWWTDEDMGHAFVVPVVILWILWMERTRWRSYQPKPSAWGFVLLLAGCTLQCLSVLGAGLYAACVGFLVSIAGAVLCLGGFRLLRGWAFLFLLSLFMLPKLAIVYNQATLPLQLLASRMAASMLSAMGVTVIREGNVLNVGAHRVLVAEACNGLRYLLPLGFVSLVFGYLADRKPWMRAALLAAAVPLAILGNAFRIAVSAYAPALSQGIAHSISGVVIFVVCIVGLVCARHVFNSIHTRYV